MDEQSPERIKKIFHQAAELLPEQRSSFLDEACGADSGARQRVERLLRSLEDVGPFLASPTENVVGSVPTRSAMTSLATAAVGTSIGPYKLLQLIGEGGFGAVYMAEQQHPVRRRVALKIIKAGMDTDQIIARFEAERQALAMMDHPNIASVLDAGATEGGRPYFVMELVKGVSITEYCDTENLNTRERLSLFMDVCSAVQHAHQKGIIHRDIKPSNVMVTLHDDKPVPKVIDFGIAKATQQRLTEKTMFTAYGQFIGSPAYMSPEQARMSGLDIDTRSDIFSLGVLLYELLTGTTPFDPKTLRNAAHDEIQRMIVEDEPPPPSTRLSTLGDALTDVAKHRHAEPETLTRQVRGDLDWIVMKALEKNRRRRYDSASAFAADVARYFNKEPVEARPPSRTYRVRKFASKHRGPVAAGLVLFVAIALGFAVSTVLYFRATEARESEARQRHVAEHKSYVANVSAAASNLRAFEVAEAKQRLDACKPDLRGWEWWHLKPRTDQSLATLTGHDGIVWSVAVSPDGTRIASGSADRTVRVWDAASGEPLLTLTGHEAGVNWVAFSPDAARIASGSDDKTVRVWDALSGESLLTLRGHDDWVGPVAFSPDGTRIASGSGDKTIRLWDAGSGELVATLMGHTKLVRPVLFSPDGTKLVSTSTDMTIRLWDVASAAPLKTLARYDGFIFGIDLAVSPDGRRIYSGSWDEVIRIWDASTGEALGTLGGHDTVVTALAVNGDGSRVFSAAGDGSIRIWDSASRELLATLVGHDDWIPSLAVTPDDARIVTASGDGTLRIWSATPDDWPARRIDHGRQVNSVAISPDGKRVASASRDKTVRLWDADTGDGLLTLRGHDGRVFSVAFSPDGRRVASGGQDDAVRVWDAASGDLLRTLEGADSFTSVTFSPDGSRIAASGQNVRIWDAASGVLVSEKAYTEWMGTVAFSPDGKRLVSSALDRSDSDKGTILVWDAESGEDLVTWRSDIGWGSVVFSSDGEQVIGSAGKEIRVWDADSGEPIGSLSGDQWSSDIAVFPDGSRIVSNAGESVRVWDLATGDVLLTLRGHERPVSSVTVSRDGRRIVSAAVDGSIRIWDTPPDYQPPESRVRSSSPPS